MKKGVLIVSFIFLVLTLGSNFIFAANATELRQVNEAYSCLNEKIDEGCSKLSENELIFSYLATGKCLDELSSASKSDNECWPESRCNIKMTSQALFALEKKNQDTSSTIEWLMEQKIVPTNLNWYLQIESDEAAICSIYYDGTSYPIEIGEDKKITSSAGECLSLTSDGYWLGINALDNCYELDYEIQCQSDFFTTLLFKKKGSETLHVLDETNSKPAGGTALERINSFCFATGSNCDYESNLWATMVLDIAGEDVSSIMPYLITSAEREYFPDPFLYSLTGFSEYKTNIMAQQINTQYWRVVENKYYDTALALLPFAGESFEEKSSAIEWLLNVQEESGCWEGGNVKDTAFILYSLWPRASSSGGGDDTDYCSDFNYFCETSGNCEGETFSEYECSGSQVCCSEEYVEPTCYESGGEICGSGEFCDGDYEYSSDGRCCLAECKPNPLPEESACEEQGGFCQYSQCEEGYEDISYNYECSEYTDYCCVEESGPGIAGYWWIWVLFVLIILVIIAIIYKDKLKVVFMKMSGKSPPPSKAAGNFPRRPGMPPVYNRMPQRRPPIQRRIVPQERRPIRPPVQKSQSPRELDDVLKKLKEMSD